MSFLKKLFSRDRAEPEAGASERVNALVEQVKAQARPCLRLAPGGTGASSLGGETMVSGDWPCSDGRPLSLVAQIDLAEAQAAGGIDWLPREGRLLFFYDVEAEAWGFRPDDAGSWAVRHETGGAGGAAPDDLSEDMRFPRRAVDLRPDPSYADSGRLDLDEQALSGKERKALEKALEALSPPEPAHQIGGYPAPIQGDDMELQCQLVSHGLDLGNSKGYRDQRVEGLRPGAADWRLLLQLDSDEAAGMTWGDGGRLYFWIREQDARAGDFTKVWAILQCY